MRGLTAWSPSRISKCECGPVERKELPLAEAPRAHVEVMAPGAFGKIVLVP